MSTQPKTVIFARVSSKAQEIEGYSLDSQLKLLRGYCKKKRLNVVKEFKIAETASKSQCRTAFRELLKLIRSDQAYHLVVEKTDRAVRNMKDAADIYEWIEDDEKRVLHSVKEGLELHKYSRSQVKLMWSIFVAFAKQYTDGLREEAMKGWAEKLAQGWLPAPPPPGYVTVTEQGKRIHVPNPETSMSLEPLFRFALLPDTTILKATSEAANLGLTSRKGKPLSKSYIQKILRNPFYIGINRFDGKDYPGAQEPLISKELFYAVQDKLNGRGHTRKKSHNPVFRGMIHCVHCHDLVVWQTQKGRFYGTCKRRADACRGKKMLREDRVEARLTAILEEIKDPKRKLITKIEDALHVGRPDAIVGKHRDGVIKSLNRQLRRIEDMADALYEDKLTNYISAERFEEKRQDLAEQTAKTQARLDRLQEVQGEQGEKLEPLSKHPIANLYLQSSPTQKRTIMSQLYKEMWSDGGAVEFLLR